MSIALRKKANEYGLVRNINIAINILFSEEY